jgi:hypothetical protein
MAKSECTNILNLIPLYIDNMLSDEENDIVCEHIKECASCRGEYEFLKSIMAGAESLPEIEVPKDFHETLMNKVRAEAKGQKLHRHKFSGWRSFAGIAAAAAVVAVSIVSYINLEGNGNSVNPDEFIPSTYPSEAPGQPNSDQGTDVVLPGVDAEDKSEHTQSPESDESGNAAQPSASAQTPSGAKTDNNNQSGQTPAAADKNTVKPDNSPSAQPPAADNRSNGGTAPETPMPADVNSNDISAFKTDNDVDEATEPNVVSDSAGQEAKSGGGGSSKGSLGADPAANGATAERAARFRVINVTVSEEEFSRAKEILSGYQKDKTGYRMEQDADSVLSKLEKLKGFSAKADLSADADSDYIVLKGE